MEIFPKLIYRFNVTPIKIPADFFFAEIDKLILVLLWTCEGTGLAKPILRKEQSWELSGLHLPELGFSSIKRVWTNSWFQWLQGLGLLGGWNKVYTKGHRPNTTRSPSDPHPFLQVQCQRHLRNAPTMGSEKHANISKRKKGLLLFFH